jgi:putative transposase
MYLAIVIDLYSQRIVERFFGSLKHDGIFKIAPPTREHMKQKLAPYMGYYNQARPDSKNDDNWPVNFEKYPAWVDQNNTTG